MPRIIHACVRLEQKKEPQKLKRKENRYSITGPVEKVGRDIMLPQGVEGPSNKSSNHYHGTK